MYNVIAGALSRNTREICNQDGCKHAWKYVKMCKKIILIVNWILFNALWGRAAIKDLLS